MTAPLPISKIDDTYDCKWCSAVELIETVYVLVRPGILVTVAEICHSQGSCPQAPHCLRQSCRCSRHRNG